ncbi:MAG: carbon starvation CstA family protein [Synergistaceae bacterium]|nr:carbon starvation CstA family protein [Synergistaceae bacterium]
MNLGVLLGVSFIVLLLGYVFYGRYLAKQWGVNLTKDAEPTPAHAQLDNIDFVPAKAPVLLGHHFSSIAGAGPINGPILAAFFGWLPVTIWVLIGGIFVGGVHDFGALFASIKNRGNSIAAIIENSMGLKARRLFVAFAYLTLLFICAAFSAIVAHTFAADVTRFGNVVYNETAETNAITAMISIWFIVIAVVFGYLVYGRKFPLGITTAFALLALLFLMYFSLSYHPLYLSSKTWLFIIGAYIAVASVVPVWLLLQPRDYLSSFLLYAMMIIAVVGIFGLHPTTSLPAMTDNNFIAKYSDFNSLFPALFIVIACGAVSGFHSLVSSGTSSKQLNKESDSLLIGYGSMLIESFLAIIALCTIAYVWDNEVAILASGEKMSTPVVIFAKGLSRMVQVLFNSSETAYDLLYTFFVLSVSVFCLTSLDSATRIARYLFQEFWLSADETPENTQGFKRILVNPYVATFITVGLAMVLGYNGYANIWPLFGATNQLLAALALLGVAAWLDHIGRNNHMIYIPMFFMLITALYSLAQSAKSNYRLLASGGDLWPAVRLGIVILLLILVADLIVNVIFEKLKR